MSGFRRSFDFEKHRMICQYRYWYETQVGSLFRAKDRTTLHNDHENNCDYSNEHYVNTPVEELVGEDAMENKKRCLQKSISEAAGLLVHIRRETSKRLDDKLLRFLQNSPMPAEEYGTHL